jgi:DNA processing protein
MSARITLHTPPHCLLPGQPNWPTALANLRDPPTELHVAGKLPDLSGSIAIVGTRYADQDALAFTRKLAREVASAGRAVVSGGATGIDAAAHEGALQAGGRTVAVLATGLVHAYPPQHARLFGVIASSGALLSEYADNRVGGRAWVFLKRNRLIAALATTVVIVQAPGRSGALSTARCAKALKRRVLAVPGAPWDPRSTGCLQLLHQGAEICASAADVLSLGPSDPAQGQFPLERSEQELNEHAGLRSPELGVWRWLRAQAGHPDQMAAALDMPAGEVQEALLTLVLSGLCRQRPDGTYERTAARPLAQT